MNSPSENLNTGILGKLKELARFARQNQLQSGKGYRVRQTSNGTVLDILSGAGSSTTATPATGLSYRGEWDSETSYQAQEIVTRGILGEFISVTDNNQGNYPEAGAPNWHGWTYPPPGVWA